MTLDYLKYFIAVAERLNFTKAARECHIAQTAMSRCIANLELEVGVELFKRSTHSVTLTPAGAFFYRKIKALLEDYDEAVEETRKIAGQAKNTLHIGIGPFGRSKAFQLIRQSQAACPELQMILEHCRYEEMLERLRNGTLDAAFFLPEVKDIIEEQGFFVLPVMTASKGILLFSEDHPFAKRDKITPEDLSEETFLTTSGSDGPTSLENLKKVLRRYDITPKRFLSTNSFETELLMIESGMGVAVAPGFVAEELPAGVQIRHIPYGEIDSFVICCWPPNRSPALEQFLRCVAPSEMK